MNNQNKLRVHSFEEGMQNPEQVMILDLSGKNITTIELDILNFSNLKTLVVDNNPGLYSFPDEIEYVPMLESLSISGCDISLLTQLHKIPALRTLTCRNMVGEVRKEKQRIYGLKNLRVLDLSGNKLDRIEESVANLDELEILIADNCQISTIADDIFFMKKLEKISLRNNRLSMLPEKLFELPALKTLLLAGKDNKLKGIDVKLKKLMKEKPGFETDYQLQEKALLPDVELAEAVQQQLKRLGIPLLTPGVKERFVMHEGTEYQVPQAISKFLWGHDWNVQGLTLKWNEQGKQVMLYDYDDEGDADDAECFFVDLSAAEANHLEVFDEQTKLITFGTWKDGNDHHHNFVFNINDLSDDPVVYVIDFEGEYEDEGNLSDFLALLMRG